MRLAVDNLNRTGAVVVNIVSDNATSNVSMFGHLGAKITHPDDLKVNLDLKNVLGEDIFVVIDNSHVIKLIRGSVGSGEKVLYTTAGKIEWRYIEQLQYQQRRNHLHLATKLKLKHVEFEKQKMKVYLATQADIYVYYTVESIEIFFYTTRFFIKMIFLYKFFLNIYFKNIFIKHKIF